MSASGITDCKDSLCRYYTPQALADAGVAYISRYYPAPKLIMEPHVGGGAFAKACRTEWPEAELVTVDMDPDAEGHQYAYPFCLPQRDFLNLTPSRKYDLIIGNPPFDNSDKHVMHASRHLAVNGRLAFLLSAHFFESKSRHYVPLPSVKMMIAPRPRFTGRADSSPYYFCIWSELDFRTNSSYGNFGRLIWIPERKLRGKKAKIQPGPEGEALAVEAEG